MFPTPSYNATMAANRAWHLRAKGPVVCFPVKNRSLGIWFAQDPTDKAFPTYILQFVIMNLLSHTLHLVLRPFKQPKLVCNFLAGLIMSPTVMGRIAMFRKMLIRPEDILLTRTIGYFGSLYVIFVLAVKTDCAVVARNLRKAAFIGCSGVFASFFMLLASNSVLELPGVKKGCFRMLFAVGVSATRFPSVAYTFNEMNIMTSELGQLAVSCTMISELIGWCGYLIGLFLRFPPNRRFNLVYVLAVPMFSYLGLRPGIQYISRRSPEGIPVKETYVLMILLGPLAVGFMCDLVSLLHVGFLVVGLMIPIGTPMGATLAEKTELVVMELFFPLYFVSVGYSLDLSLLEFRATVEIFVIVMMVALVKLSASAASAYFVFNMSFCDSILLGLMLVIKGSYDLILYGHWASDNLILKPVFTALAISEVVVTGIVTPLIGMFYSPHARLTVPTGENARFFIATSRNAELRVLCCLHGEDDVPGVISLLEALTPTKDSPVCAHVLHLKELVGGVTPDIRPYDGDLRNFKPTSSTHIIRAFEKDPMCAKGTVRVRLYSVTSAHRSMHEYICRLALQEQIPLIIIPSGENRQVSTAELATVRSINGNVQAYSPCTVGLLFSKGNHCLGQAVNHLTSVAILFITGNDDREALALGIRMTGHPKLRVTLIRVIVVGWECKSIEEKAEKKLDDLMVHQFVAERGENERVGYHEFAAENHEQVMKWMRELGGGHDLFVMGRKRRKVTESMDEDTMLEWSENPELGVLGDLMASAEYLAGTTVLVMQHFGDVYAKARNQMSEEDAMTILKLNS